MNNPYRPLPKEQVLKNEKIKKEAESALKDLSESAKRVFSSDDFVHLKQKFLEIRDRLISLMILYVDPDPVKDDFFLRGILNKLDIYNEIIKSVEKNAKK